MKKIIKTIAAAAGVTGAVALINSVIFKRGEAKMKSGRSPDAAAMFPYNEFRYEWRHATARYIVRGEGEPLVLLHDASVGGGLADWKKMIPLLARQYRVYAVDLPGFGRSGKPRFAYSSYFYVSFINDFISDCAGGGAHIVARGASCGFAAAGYAMKPENYMKMLFIRGDDKNILPGALARAMGRFIEVPVYGTFLYNLISSKTAVGAERHSYSHCGGAGNKYPVAALLQKFLYVDLNRFVNKIKIPVLSVRAGKRDSYPGEPRSFYRTINSFFTPE